MGDVKKDRTGRPAKFREPSRPVTVTLPERVLGSLDRIDADRARAIVKATESMMRESTEGVQLVEVAPSLALIIVGRSHYLQKIEWLQLVEISPSRYLLSIPPGTPVDSLEIAITDLLEACPEDDKHERKTLSQLQRIVKQQRLKRTIFKHEILLVKLAVGITVAAGLLQVVVDYRLH